MCLLNGECGGTLPASITFHETSYEDDKGNTIIEKVKVYNLIQELVNHWGMTAGINNSKRSEHRITKSELNQLVMACRYLLNGKYSVEAEDIMSNEFIDVLGSMLPSYEYPLNKDVWYVDKNDDGYILSKGDSVGNKEYYEEEKYGRMILKRLLSIFNVMNISDEEYGYVNNNFDTITELVLIYSAY